MSRDVISIDFGLSRFLEGGDYYDTSSKTFPVKVSQVMPLLTHIV